MVLIEEYEIAKQSAIELFEKEKYKEAFYIFVGLYNQIEAIEEKDWIHSILMDAYYLPNKEEQEKLYQKNIMILGSYPYFYGKLKKENRYLFCPNSEEEIGIYDQELKKWIEYVTIQTEQCTKNLFVQLEKDENMRGGVEAQSKPLFYENEVNKYHLTYLNDTVRKSEYCGMDNHIYLYYDHIYFELLLHYIDLEQIATDTKFVFLIGEQTKKNYPINFKKEYGIDYERMEIKEFFPDELQRIIYNKWYRYSGCLFFHEIMCSSNYVLDIMCGAIYRSSSRMIRLYHYFINHPYRNVNIQHFFGVLERYDSEIQWEYKENIRKILDKLLRNEENNILFYKLWKWIMIAMMRNSYEVEGKNYYSRLIPTIYLDPHEIKGQDEHYSLIQCFKYPVLAGVVRDPVIKLVRVIDGFGPSNEEILKKAILEICDSTRNIPSILMDKYWVMKFEDLKINPAPILREFCKIIQIPYSTDLLKGAIGIYNGSFGNERGEVIKGFDSRSIFRDMTDCLPEFDKIRLEIAYRRIKESYGYDIIKQYNYTKQEIEFMFSIPFQFEKRHRAIRASIEDTYDTLDEYERFVVEDRGYLMSIESMRRIVKETLVEVCTNEKLYVYPIPKLIL